MSNELPINKHSDHTLAIDVASLRLVPNAEGWKEVSLGDRLSFIPFEWIAKKVGKVAKNISGATPPTGDKRYWGGGRVWVTPKDMDNMDGVYLNNSAKTLTDEGYLFMSKREVPPGAVVFSTRGSIGKVGVASKEIRISQSCEAYLFANCSSEYAAYFFRKHMDDLKRMGAGTTFMSVTKKDIEDMVFVFSPRAEQTRIAAILSTQESQINDLKALAQAERDRLSWLTNELLSGRVRVVPRQGGAPLAVEVDSDGRAVEALDAFDLVPNAEGWKEVEINGVMSPLPKSWCVEKLKSISLIVAGQSPDGTLVSKGNPDNEYVDFHQGNADFGDISTQLSGKRIKREQAPRIAKANSLLLSVRAPVGAVNYSANELCFGRGLCAITAKANISIDYLRLQIVKQSLHLHRMADGSTFVAVTNHQVSNLEVPTPPQHEQIRIAAILSAQERQVADIESLIKLEEQRLSWLTDELLSGRIRVVEGEHE